MKKPSSVSYYNDLKTFSEPKICGKIILSLKLVWATGKT